MYGIKFDGEWYATGFETAEEAWVFVVCHGLDMIGVVLVELFDAE